MQRAQPQTLHHFDVLAKLPGRINLDAYRATGRALDMLLEHQCATVHGLVIACRLEVGVAKHHRRSLHGTGQQQCCRQQDREQPDRVQPVQRHGIRSFRLFRQA